MLQKSLTSKKESEPVGITWAYFAFILTERRNQLAILISSLQLLSDYDSLVCQALLMDLIELQLAELKLRTKE